tara:strand:+ start:2087 stop:2461 length:375 start_codon:yes stop_codon:yes gene_type:complete
MLLIGIIAVVLLYIIALILMIRAKLWKNLLQRITLLSYLCLGPAVALLHSGNEPMEKFLQMTIVLVAFVILIMKLNNERLSIRLFRVNFEENSQAISESYKSIVQYLFLVLLALGVINVLLFGS